MSQFAIFPAKLWERSSEKEMAVRAAAICDTLGLATTHSSKQLELPSRRARRSCEMRIDAHQHFWLPERITYAWMKSLGGEPARRLVRPVLPPELSPILVQHGIARTVLVQAATDPAEADFLL